MVKIIAAITAFVLLTLTACGDKPLNKPDDGSQAVNVDNINRGEAANEGASDSNGEASEAGRGEDKTAADTSEATETVTEATTVIVNTEGLSNEKIGWYFNPNNEHVRPTAAEDIDYLKKYNAYYMSTNDEKAIYLTFDEGYENGYSSKILDVLKEKDVKAAFFVTKPYIEQNKELINRMVNEGHVVGNHSVKHLSLPDLSDDEIRSEITDTAACFKEVTGRDMPKVFRPPMGEFSERTLAVTQGLGYKTIFWSFAHRDWLTDDQPGKDAAYNTVMKRYHNGCVMLLHAVSQSNTEALPDIIDSLRAEGYEFKSLEEIE